MAELDIVADRPRFYAVGALRILMEESRTLDRRIAALRKQIPALRRHVIEQGERTRKFVDEFIANGPAWKALTPKQRTAILKADMERNGAKRIARWLKNQRAKAAA